MPHFSPPIHPRVLRSPPAAGFKLSIYPAALMTVRSRRSVFVLSGSWWKQLPHPTHNRGEQIRAVHICSLAMAERLPDQLLLGRQHPRSNPRDMHRSDALPDRQMYRAAVPPTPRPWHPRSPTPWFRSASRTGPLSSYGAPNHRTSGLPGPLLSRCAAQPHLPPRADAPCSPADRQILHCPKHGPFSSFRRSPCERARRTPPRCFRV